MTSDLPDPCLLPPLATRAIPGGRGWSTWEQGRTCRSSAINGLFKLCLTLRRHQTIDAPAPTSCLSSWMLTFCWFFHQVFFFCVLVAFCSQCFFSPCGDFQFCFLLLLFPVRWRLVLLYVIKLVCQRFSLHSFMHWKNRCRSFKITHKNEQWQFSGVQLKEDEQLNYQLLNNKTEYTITWKRFICLFFAITVLSELKFHSIHLT